MSGNNFCCRCFSQSLSSLEILPPIRLKVAAEHSEETQFCRIALWHQRLSAFTQKKNVLKKWAAASGLQGTGKENLVIPPMKPMPTSPPDTFALVFFFFFFFFESGYRLLSSHHSLVSTIIMVNQSFSNCFLLLFFFSFSKTGQRFRFW